MCWTRLRWGCGHSKGNDAAIVEYFAEVIDPWPEVEHSGGKRGRCRSSLKRNAPLPETYPIALVEKSLKPPRVRAAWDQHDHFSAFLRLSNDLLGPSPQCSPVRRVDVDQPEASPLHFQPATQPCRGGFHLASIVTTGV